MRLAYRWILLLSVGTACSAAVTGPCEQLVTPVLVGRLIQRNNAGCLIRVDSLYSRVDVLADTFRVCGADTVKVSRANRKFATDDVPVCV